MHKIIYSILPVLLLFTFVKGYSQTEKNQDTLDPCLFNSIETPSYVTFGKGYSNLGPLLYEANISPNLKINPEQLPNFGFVFIPQILIRMYDQFSHPVRTPSYMPRGTVYYHFDNKININNQFVFLTLGHHSNGQDGLLYESDSVTINTKDGSFATNYLAAGYEYFSNNQNNFKPVNGLCLTTMLHKIHDTDVRYLYGKLRFKADLKSTYQFKHEFRNIITNTKERPMLTGMLHLEWIALDKGGDKPFDLDRLILNYTLSYQPAFISDLEVFARIYYGQDYYNINFERKLQAFQVGLSIRDFSFR